MQPVGVLGQSVLNNHLTSRVNFGDADFGVADFGDAYGFSARTGCRPMMPEPDLSRIAKIEVDYPTSPVSTQGSLVETARGT